MARQNPLAQALEQTQAKPAETPAAHAGLSVQSPSKARARAPSREGQTLVGGFFSAEVHRQLRVLAAETDRTQQALLAEGLNMLFAKYGKPEIATLGRILRGTT